MPLGIYIRTKEHCEKISNAQKGRPLTSGSFKKGHSYIPLTEKGRKKISISLKGNSNGFRKGQIPWNKGTKGVIKSWNKGIKTGKGGNRINNPKGKEHWNWKGGISPIYDEIKKTQQYKNWRRDVFIRDHFTCQKCGHRFIKIIAHHIKEFSEYKDLWFELDNGVTLCRSCHMKLHKPKKKLQPAHKGEL